MWEALLLTAAVAGDRDVCTTTQELEQTFLKELSFCMRGKGPFLDLPQAWGLAVQVKLEVGAP